MPKRKPLPAYVGHTSWAMGTEDEAAEEKSTRRRRSRQEIDQLILEAARALFAAKGYEGTTLREVATEAGVYQPMIYRRFNSKRDLFEAAVVKPLDGMAAALLTEELEEEGAPVPTVLRAGSFIETLYALLIEYRRAWIAIVTGQGVDGDFSESDEPAEVRGARWLFDRLMPNREYKAASLALREDAPPTVLVVLSMVLGAALLDPYFSHVSQGRMTQQRMRDEMIRVCLNGIAPSAHSSYVPKPSLPSAVEDGQASSRELALELLNRVADAERRAVRAEMQLEQVKQSEGGEVARTPQTPQTDENQVLT